MSKPNLLSFSTSIGFYRNPKIRESRSKIGSEITRKIDFCELTPTLFQTVLAHCAENQVDGNLAGYSDEGFREIFLVNHIELTLKEAVTIRKIFESVGLFDAGKVRSWSKFNRHLASHEKTLRDRQKAGKAWQKKKLQIALQSPPETDPKSEKNGSQNGSQSQQIWQIEKALELAPEGSPERKELLQKKRQLLSQSTGVDLSKKSRSARPAPPAPTTKRNKAKPGDALMMARHTLADAPDMLTDSMAAALIDAGELPAALKGKFRKLLEQREKEEAGHNPVPG